MKVEVNGDLRELPDETTVAELLRELELDRDGIAVAVDGQVVPRTRHADTPLADGARVEVIRAVGGG